MQADNQEKRASESDTFRSKATHETDAAGKTNSESRQCSEQSQDRIGSKRWNGAVCHLDAVVIFTMGSASSQRLCCQGGWSAACLEGAGDLFKQWGDRLHYRALGSFCLTCCSGLSGPSCFYKPLQTTVCIYCIFAFEICWLSLICNFCWKLFLV